MGARPPGRLLRPLAHPLRLKERERLGFPSVSGGGTGIGIGIAEEAEGSAVGDDGPEGIGRGVEEFLGKLVAATP